VNSSSQYRSQQIADAVIGFSISYQRENCLARGLGVAHLRELLLGLARPMIRQGASLAFGGYWKETEENFTYDLLHLISAEQVDSSLGAPGSKASLCLLYNHASWPNYLEVTPQIEAQWINCCRIVRITQQDAGLPPEAIVPDAEAHNKSPRTIFNAAVTLSVMRRLTMQPWKINLPDFSKSDTIPAVVARVVLGGKKDHFAGFLPGIFEETLATLEAGRPLYLLGGFGGATEILAQTILAAPDAPRPTEFSTEYYKKNNPGYADLLKSATELGLPDSVPPPASAFDKLWEKIVAARTAPADILKTGLTDAETRQLLTTQDMHTAIRLVRKGLGEKLNLKALPA
jgi:hypothetical protein